MSRNKYLPLAELLVAFLIAFFIIDHFFGEKRHFEDLDLGSQTSSYFALIDSAPIHLSSSRLTDFKQLVKGWHNRGEKPVLLILGNSQTHAINQLKAGQANYPEILFKRLSHQIEPLSQSLPNANLQEFYLIYSYWSTTLPVKKVLLPVFVDDLREDGIRDVYSNIFIESGFRINDTSEIATDINKQLASFKPSTGATIADPNMKALRETVQEKSEVYLNNELQKRSTSWRNRETVRGSVFEFLYKLRNTVLFISPQSKRSVIPALKDKNLTALQLILADALKKNIQVYVYIPPIRYDVDPPYYEKEYNAVIQELQQMISKYPNARFGRFDKIIDGKYWGTKDPTAFFRKREFDFMHFQYAGHITLADSLYSFLNR
jgi:hypothetical protein